MIYSNSGFKNIYNRDIPLYNTLGMFWINLIYYTSLRDVSC